MSADWLREAFETSDALSGRVKEGTKNAKGTKKKTVKKKATRKSVAKQKSDGRKRVGLASSNNA